MRVAKKKVSEVRTGPKRKKWRFDLLESVGDSILIKGDASVLSKSAYSSLGSYKRATGHDITITTSGEKKGLRIWRIK